MGAGLQGHVYAAVFISCSAGVALATGDVPISMNWEYLEELCVLVSFPLEDCNQKRGCHRLCSLKLSFTLLGSCASHSSDHLHISFSAIHHKDVTMDT